MIYGKWREFACVASLSHFADCGVSPFSLACFRLTGNRNRRIMISTIFSCSRRSAVHEAARSIQRTPPRRYDQAPPPPPEEKRTLEPAIRKRYFEIPAFRRGRMDKLLGGALCAVMLLTLCNASAPMNDVPGVQERFTQWAAVQNEKTVQRLPGSARPSRTAHGQPPRASIRKRKNRRSSRKPKRNAHRKNRNQDGCRAERRAGGYLNGL